MADQSSDEFVDTNPGSIRNESEQYTIRWFQHDDRDEYISLYKETLGDPTEETFTWKFERNPFVDYVPVIVAETQDMVVGGMSYIPLVMQTGQRSVPAVISAGGFVHPDHRRQGLYTQMMRTGLEYYAKQSMAFVFDMTANDKSWAANEKYLGWKLVRKTPPYIRIQKPDKTLASRTGNPYIGKVCRWMRWIAHGYFSLRKIIPEMTAPDITIEQYNEAPVDLLTAIYQKDIPKKYHAIRSERFYHWRLKNPLSDYQTYIAFRNNLPIASIIIGSQIDKSHIRILDALPLCSADVLPELKALLVSILNDYSSARLVSTLPGTIPSSLLSGFGFLRSDQFPFSHFTRPLYHGVRPFDDVTQEDISLTRLTDPSYWKISYIEHNSI